MRKNLTRTVDPLRDTAQQLLYITKRKKVTQEIKALKAVSRR